MEQIIYWNLVDGYAYVENPTPEKIACQQGDMTIGENVYYGGLLRFDMTPKPAYYTIRDLFGKVWHTETEGATNEKGEIRFRGFFGEYEVGAWAPRQLSTAKRQCLQQKTGRERSQ